MKQMSVIIFIAIFIITGCKSTTVPGDDLVHDWDADDVQNVDSKDVQEHYRIIAFSGGGIKGALTAKILLMLTESVPQLLDDIHLFAGTSTGGIIGLGLSYGLTPAELLSLYLDNGDKIFAEYPALVGLERGIVTPLYTNENLKTLLEEKFSGNPVLGDLKISVVINSFQLDDDGWWRPVYFHNYSGSPHTRELAVDVALRTGAAPVYFPAYQGYIDGGVFANNPSLVALSVALDKKWGNVDIEDIRLLSFGTGSAPVYIEKKSENWGATQWLNPFGKPATPLLDILMGGVAETDDYQCSMILGDQYKRFNVILKENYGMDDWKHVADLVKEAEGYVTEHPDEWKALVSWVVESFLE